MLEPVSFSKGQGIEPPRDFKELLLKYFYFWPWFVLGLSIALISSYFYINSASVIYTTKARIKIINEKSIPESFMGKPILFDKPNINIRNEIALFKSYQLTEEVVKALDLNINYSHQGTVNKNTIKNTPFKVEYKRNKDSIKVALNFKITIEEAGYTIKKEGTEEVINTNDFWFDSDNESFPIQINPKNNSNITELKKENYFISINPIKTTTKKYINNIKVTSDDENTNLLTLSLRGYNSLQNELILNKLITVYDNDGIRDQKEISKRIFSFLDERLAYLLSELEIIEKNKKEYKTSNKISYRRNDANIAINERLSKDNTLFEIESQLLILEDMKNSIFKTKNSDFELLPSNIGLTNSNINSLIDNFNNSVLEVYDYKQSAGENNPKLKLLKATILEIKRNIISSTDGYKQQLRTSLKQIKKAQIITNSTFAEIPKKENILRTIERKQELKENLYMMLLRKREEAAINFGITTSNVKVIDFGFTDPQPNTSNKEIYLIASAIGLLVPFGIIYLLFLLNSKIFESKDITAVTKEIPILYEIPLFENEQLNNLTEKAHQQEVFRTLMYNTLFIKPKETKDSGISILVTSSISGEGKTFIAINLAKSLAEKGKKVVLLGGDLRNPKIHKFLNLEKTEKGIVSYVLDSKLDIPEITTSFSEDLSSFDIIFSGIAQSIPTTILANPRFETLMSKLKNEYDYVVIDSAPTHLVSDTLIFAASADITLLVTRFRYTDKKLINFSMKLAKERKLKNMAYVVNGMKRSSYGYGYGYGVAHEKKKWYHF